MFASFALAAAAQILPIVVPLGKPAQLPPKPIRPAAIYGPQWAEACKGSTDWDKPAPPVGIFGNTYLVGTCGISSILITGPQGHILIDGGTEQGADLIAENIRSLGFRLSDIRYLLFSHEHLDHVGGIARLQRLTGAQLVSSPAAAAVLNSGTARGGDPQAGMHPPFPPAQVDRIINDGEEVRLGNSVVIAVATPGHTPGAMSWRWGSCEAGRCRQFVYADSLTAISRDDYRFSAHPQYLAQFRASIAKIAALPCDILLTPHTGASNMEKRLAGDAPLEDANACRNHAARLTTQLDERLAKEAAGK
ncbi:MAG TPA: subclass B3 metallo-beta-lactamase [Sphingomicrobium sp.]|nr:subclass B3 metallo-beta-lactamase [Sphingomicrobium sp.]